MFDFYLIWTISTSADCATIVNNCNKIILKHVNATNLRDLLKIDTNNNLWIIAKELVHQEKLNFNISKVQAHTTNVLHNLLDNTIKKKYEDINNLHNIVLDFNSLTSYEYIPTWNNQYVEMNLRRFIRNLCRANKMEEFLNLKRNHKYRDLDINWNITLQYINYSEECTTTFKTTAKASKRKRKKIQRLLEELPTIEQMKKKSHDLYSGLLCNFC